MPGASAGTVVALDCPPGMAGAIEEVLAGEYECGYSSRDGDALTVLDIGANAGAFALWAAMRWPGCRVHCYEPHPLTFVMLCGNVGGNPAIEKLLEGQFSLAYQDRFPWSALLSGSRYRPDLEGDSYGHLLFVNRGHNLLRLEEGIAAGQRVARSGRARAVSSLRSSLGTLVRVLRSRR